jgi:hypothetical protein
MSHAILIFQPPGDRAIEVFGPFPDGTLATRWGAKFLDGLPSTSWFWLDSTDAEAADYASAKLIHANLDII